MRLLATYATLVSLIPSACDPAEGGISIPSTEIEREQIEVLPLEARFVGVRDLVTSGSKIWVLDEASPFLTRADLSDGTVVRFGLEGDGPGEMRDPRAIQLTEAKGDSTVLAWDFHSGLVSEFDGEGHFVGSEHLEIQGRIRARSDIQQVSFGEPFRVRRNGSKYVAAWFPSRIDRTADLIAGILHQGNRQLGSGQELLRFSNHMAGGSSDLKEWAAIPFWDACAGSIMLWSPVSQTVVSIVDGRTTASVPFPYQRTNLRLDDRERYLEWMGRLELGPDYKKTGADFRSLAQAYEDRFAEFQPLVTDLRCESEEVSWLRLFDTTADPLGRSPTWLRVSARGSYERFRFPPEFTPFVFREKTILGVVEVQDGYQTLARWSPGITIP